MLAHRRRYTSLISRLRNKLYVAIVPAIQHCHRRPVRGNLGLQQHLQCASCICLSYIRSAFYINLAKQLKRLAELAELDFAQLAFAKLLGQLTWVVAAVLLSQLVYETAQWHGAAYVDPDCAVITPTDANPVSSRATGLTMNLQRIMPYCIILLDGNVACMMGAQSGFSGYYSAINPQLQVDLINTTATPLRFVTGE